MKRFSTFLCVLGILLSMAVTVSAAGSVAYVGGAEKFIFAPGSEHSPTDLFKELKNVMPGDSITQHITVENDASNKVKVKIYMRSLGAHEDSEAFLSKLRLRVEKSEENTMAYMFDAAASQTAQLTDWVCLGTLSSGGSVNLNVILDVPVELDNGYQQRLGYLDWEFMIEEYPIEPTDPEPPKTGDEAPIWAWLALMGLSLCAFILLIVLIRRGKKDE